MKRAFGMDNSNWVLTKFGLERRRDPLMDIVVPSVALVAAGAVLGATAALLLAPKPGKVMRRELSDGARGLTRKLGRGASQVASTTVGTNRGRETTASEST